MIHFVVCSGPAIEQLFYALLQSTLKDYVDLALDQMLEDGGSVNAVHLACASSASTILTRLQSYFASGLLPCLVTASPQAYRQCVQLKVAYFGVTSGKVNQVMQAEVAACIAHIRDALLVKQRRSDFRPKGDDLSALATSSQVHIYNRYLIFMCVGMPICDHISEGCH